MTAALRRATRADLDRIASLERRCFGEADGIFSRRQLRALLANPNACWLMGADGLAVACWLTAGNGHGRWARLYSLAVDPSLRGQGWGSRLILAGEDWMRKNGLGTCRAEVKSDNLAARRLYARHGFSESGTLPNYYGKGADGVRLTKEIEKRRYSSRAA